MTAKEFLNNILNGREDILALFVDLMNKMNIEYCVIGGLAVNAYVEPVVSLDLDIIIVSQKVDLLIDYARKTFKIDQFPHSFNLSHVKSDVRIQIQTDPRYQSFLEKASLKNVMGYEMKVAAVEDLLQGKLWAYQDPERRLSKRQKDLADIFRLVEKYPNLKTMLPDSLKEMV